MASPDDPDPPLDDWFEEEPPTQERQPALRRRPTLPPADERRIPAIALLGGLALLVLAVILVVALTGDGDTPAVDTATELPTPTEPTGTVETEPPATATEEQPTTLPTEGVIRPGDEGDQVRALQQALVTLGYDPGEADGNYGPATVEAIREFQTATGLPADGVAGPETLNAINAALATQG